MTRVVLWDFEGTLAHRPGMWPGCLVETLDEAMPGHGISADALRPYLLECFPWNRADTAHPELCGTDVWWNEVLPRIASAYEGAGIDPERAMALVRIARGRYIDARGWNLFPDVVSALERLRSEGWRHAILSNHVPELPGLVEGLGLGPLVDIVLTSAATGFEKPDAKAFARAREASGRPREIWMVGDNPVKDVLGAEAVGIPAILVRTRDARVPRLADDLHDAAELIIRMTVR